VSRLRHLQNVGKDKAWKQGQPLEFHKERPVQKWAASEVVAELKSLREQLQDGIKNNASSKELQPLVDRDTAIRQARPDVVKAQVTEKVERPKVSMGI
jgi:hypothetical protein